MKKMSKKKITGIICAGVILILAGIVACQDMRGRDIGTIVGAGTGAAIGSSLMHGSGTSKAVGAVGGAVVGGLVGHAAGKGMEQN